MRDRSLAYKVAAPECAQHLLRVSATISGPLPEPLVVALPVWSPGSYLIREYSRHIESLNAHIAGYEAGIQRLAKDRWAIAHGGADELVLEYTIYAHELSVRTNHVDQTHAYWNGTATYVRPQEDGVDWDAVPITLTVEPARADWQVATALAALSRGGDAGTSRTFRASGYDELVDSPVEMGQHERLDFDVRGVPHQIAVWGTPARFDRERLVRDVGAIVAAEADLFGALPTERYLFVLHLAPHGRGGLEHANSSSLLASPEAFETADGYDDLLSLFAHEYLHLWLAKRIRPAGLARYDYARENYTRLLWFFEGGASYYDWLVLRRAGLVEPRTYLRHLANEIARLGDTPGRLVHSLEAASFDAWIKLYRPDEHSVNSTVSYYLKGEVACALLDLEIRARSAGRRSLDDVLRHLWERHGAVHRSVPEQSFEAIVAAATDVDVSDLIDALVRRAEPIEYARALAHAGLALRFRPGRGATMGVRVRNDGGRAIVAATYRDGAAWHAGLSPGDEIIAVDDRRVDDARLRDRLRNRRPGDRVRVLYARREQIASVELTLGEPAPDGAELLPLPNADAAARSMAIEWLGKSAASLWSTE